MKKLFPFLAVVLFLAAADLPGGELALRGFPWGTSVDEVVRRMGPPMSRETVGGFDSLIWGNVEEEGFIAFMQAYFSPAGLQGGVFHFDTRTLDETRRCYEELQRILLDRHGPTRILDRMTREFRSYASAWSLPGGLVRLRVNTGEWEPVTLWYSSPEFTALVMGN